MKLFGNTSSKKRRSRIQQTAESRPEGAYERSEAASQDTPERTPEEKREIEAMIAAYQKKKLIRRLVILGVLVILALGIIIFVKATVKPPEIVDPGLNTPAPSASAAPATPVPGGQTPEPGDEPEDTPAPTEEVVSLRKDGFYTFALIGQDQEFGNTDTILIGAYDDVNKTLDLVSIPRDTMVNVPWDVKKVNTMYSYSVRYGLADDKIEGFKAGMRDFTGFTIDSVIVVNLRAFVDLVDLIGGVYFDVPVNMNYDDPTQGLSIHVAKGYQYLTGSQAVGVVRFRNNNDGSGYYDTGRIQTQQAFLKAVAKQCLSTISVSKINDYAKIFKEDVTTDLSIGNLVWYGEKLLSLDEASINFHTLPSEQNDSVKGTSYGTVYVDDWVDMINAYLNPYNEQITVENVNLLSRPNIKDSNRSNWGDIYATSGVISGGYESFYDWRDHVSSSSSGTSSATTPEPETSTEPETSPEPDETPEPEDSPEPEQTTEPDQPSEPEDTGEE